MGTNVIYFVWLQMRFCKDCSREEAIDTPNCLRKLHSLSPTCNLGIDVCPRLRLCRLLPGQPPCSLSQHTTITPGIKRSAGEEGSLLNAAERKPEAQKQEWQRVTGHPAGDNQIRFPFNNGFCTIN